MPHQSVRKCRAPCVKLTRLAAKTLRTRPQTAAQTAAFNYRRLLKTGNIVQTSVNALNDMRYLRRTSIET
jgi:hypothetical protein